MSTISASTTSTTAYTVTADTTGALVLQTGATPTTAVTISSAQVVTLANALPIASGGTGTTSTTFANLTTNVTGTLPVANGGTGVTTSTGSGANVLGTSPTLTTPTINSAQVATVSGSAPLYMARAWVNFNGTGTVAIRSSGNVTSITDNGTGDYTVNFTTAMSDTSYSPVGVGTNGTGDGTSMVNSSTAPTTSAWRTNCKVFGSTQFDPTYAYIAVFR